MEFTMRKSFNLPSVRRLVVSVALVVMGGAALAVDLKLHLTGAEETPPVTTSASGTGTISIAADKWLLVRPHRLEAHG
jgi:hypothetical protein